MENKKAIEAINQIITIAIVVFVVAIVIIGVFKFDLIGKIRNLIPGFEQPENNNGADFKECKIAVAKINENKIKNTEIILNEAKTAFIGSTPIGYVADNIFYFSEDIFDMKKTYYDIGDKLPPYLFIFNLEGSEIVGNYFCRDSLVKDFVTKDYVDIAYISLNDEKKKIYWDCAPQEYNANFIINSGAGEFIIGSNACSEDDYSGAFIVGSNSDGRIELYATSGNQAYVRFIGEIENKKIILNKNELKDLPDAILNQIKSPSKLLELDNAEIFGDVIAKNEN